MNNINKPTIFYCVGLPASGKSTWAETHKDELNAVIHASDSIREELGNINDQSKNTEVFEILHQRIKDDLRAGKNVIMDQTGLNRKRRIHFLQNELKGIPCEKICVVFATPFEICCARNFARDRQVPEEVLIRMYKSFETPTIYDGFDDVQIAWADYKDMLGFEFDINKDMEEWKKIDHDNPHHRLSIGDHMEEAYHIGIRYTYDTRLLSAIFLHDCGKSACKSFYDHKGNPTNGIAHYYSHENVSAFLSLFYLRNMYPEWSDKDILYVSLLINLHMRPYLSWEQSTKAEEKDRRLFGDDIVSNVYGLHLCDKAAH